MDEKIFNMVHHARAPAVPSQPKDGKKEIIVSREQHKVEEKPDLLLDLTLMRI